MAYIWTNHALVKLVERGISKDMAWETIERPDNSKKTRQETTEFTKKFDNSTVVVIAKQNDKNEWVILSVWIDPPLLGTKDAKERQDYKNYQKASQAGKFWLGVKKQLGF